MVFFNQYKEDMISYVKNKLEQYDLADHPTQMIRFNRFEHIMRVYKWMERLYLAYPDKMDLDREALYIATIFHDVGYCVIDMQNHAEAGAVYCREYLTAKKYPLEKTAFICDIISRHSDKETLHDDIPGELILLMEADILDDIGAQGLVHDVWSETVRNENVSFLSILKHMEKYTLTIMQNNPMRTEEGIKIWNEKKKLTEAFVRSYKDDICI